MRKNSFIISLAFMSFVLSGCDSKQEANIMEMPAIPVIAATPTIKDVTLYIESIGTLEPSILMEIRPQVDGTLTDVLTREGQWVDPGTPLFKIDSKPYSIKVQEAEAQLAMDRAVSQASQKKLNRIRPLAQKDLVAKTEWEDMEADVEKSYAALKLNEARLNNAKLDLEHCTVYSPCSGRIGKLDAHPGFLVAKGQEKPLAEISQMNPLIVEFTITEKEFPKISKDMKQIEIKPLCSSESFSNGVISFLDNHFEPKTGLLLVRGKIQNPDYTLRPGQSVQVRIPVSIKPNATLIPQKAIRYNQQGPYIYVVQSDMTVAIRQLLLGEEQGTDQVVLEGIDSTEKLIIDGHLRLSPGIKVELKS